ncbi:nSTAND1 domain-containing NTPase [Saccharothrix syringae]|uniref:XRE family transcriptional regulator n=1 Tax=Saccharothrix syringae TaxID=103733 RepID=A0A5Q0GVF6_SACSY|nr:XRE family transcriptional regulator [Saccharothrix syringae]QFZ18057.1 XRE family transcriptional regulator [Saccharothrix syringae]
MPRGERPLDVGDGPLLKFAADLRSLRDRAGRQSYRQMGARAHYSATTLSDAAGGRKLPTLAVTLAYVRACEGDVAEWEDRWRQVAAEVLPGHEPGPDGGHPPYAGLAAYDTADAEWFFGRDDLLDDLERRIAQRRFVAVFGASGAGKSSLLRAGLVPRVRGRAAVTTPSELDVRADRLDLDAELLIVDQFEEVFTLCPDPDQRAAFIDALLTAPGRVVVGVRADFYGHCAQHPDLVEAISDGQLLLGPMGPEELRQVIMQPAVKASCTVETALVSRLVADATGQAGVLPLVSHALLETWRRRRGTTLTLAGYEAAGGIQHAIAQTAERTFTSLEKQQRELARQVFLRLTALGDGTEDTKRRLPRAELDADVDLDVVLDRLAHARLLTLDRDCVEIAHEALIRSWPRLRGWLAEDRDGLRTMRRLTEAAATWESLGRDPDALYRGSRLDNALDWTRREDVRASALEREFLDESARARDQERLLAHRRTRRLRQLVALMAVLLLCATGAGVYAIRAQSEIEEGWTSSSSLYVANQAQALRGSNPRLADQLAIAAYNINGTAAMRDGVLTAYAAGQQDMVSRSSFPDGRRPDGAALPDNRVPTPATGEYRSVTARDYPNLQVTSTAQNSALQAFATTLRNGVAQVWDVTDAIAPKPVYTFGFPVTRIAVDPRGRWVVTAAKGDPSRTGEVAVWDWSYPTPGTGLVQRASLDPLDQPDPLDGMAFSAPGDVLATYDQAGIVRLWDLKEPVRPRNPDEPRLRLIGTQPTGEAVSAVALTPDASTLAVGFPSGKVRIWDRRRQLAPRELWSAKAHPDGIRALGFHRNGLTLATVGEDDKVALWSLADRTRPVEQGRITGTTAGINGVSFEEEPTVVRTTNSNGTFRDWQFDFRIAVDEMCKKVEVDISREEWQQYVASVGVGALEYRPPCR